MGSGGAGMGGKLSPAGGNAFAGGGNVGSFPGTGGNLVGGSGAAFGGTGPAGPGGGGPYGGGQAVGTSTGGGGGAIVALTYAVRANSPAPAGSAALTPARLRPDLQDLINRSDNISAATRSGLTVGYDPEGTLVLRGTVAGPAEARALESLLRFAPGVAGVRNEMTPRTP
jgi:translation initiation factor IF-2